MCCLKYLKNTHKKTQTKTKQTNKTNKKYWGTNPLTYEIFTFNCHKLFIVPQLSTMHLLQMRERDVAL